MLQRQLQKLYRGEGINIEAVPNASGPQTHILEGGKHMHLPLPGSMGFGRLLRRKHPPYQPKTEAVRRIAQQYQALRQPVTPAK